MQIGFVLFPNVTQLDFTGPLQVLHRLPGATTHIAAKTRAPVPSDCGLALVPTTTFAECPPLDLICVPGGFGVDDAMNDVETMAFVRSQGARARYVTSVCTGAFILGAAGLLKGKRATTHWAYHDLLPMVGALPERARVVRDGNTFTGGGVTAGIDFALTVAAEIAGADVAQAIQLAIEYDPAPPFDSGAPERAPAEVVERQQKRYGARRDAFVSALTRALDA
jgi:cyclohexyl-isocyanide hydratase